MLYFAINILRPNFAEYSKLYHNGHHTKTQKPAHNHRHQPGMCQKIGWIPTRQRAKQERICRTVDRLFQTYRVRYPQLRLWFDSTGKDGRPLGSLRQSDGRKQQGDRGYKTTAPVHPGTNRAKAASGAWNFSPGNWRTDIRTTPGQWSWRRKPGTPSMERKSPGRISTHCNTAENNRENKDKPRYIRFIIILLYIDRLT